MNPDEETNVTQETPETPEVEDKDQVGLSEEGKLSVGMVKSKLMNKLEEGTLLVVTVGDKDHEPTKEDMSNVESVVDVAFRGVKGVKVLVVPHLIQIEQLSVPQLRTMQSEILTSYDPEEENPILNIEL